MERQFAEHQIVAFRVPAVDGAEIAPDEAAIFPNAYDARFPMGPGEIGCLLSHRKCWKTLLEANDPYALIMEDDVIFGDALHHIIENMDLAGLDADIVKLETNFSRTRISKSSPNDIDDRGIHKLLGKHTSTGAYIISNRCVQRLEILSQEFFLPVDQFLFNPDFPIFHELRMFQLNPAPAIQFSILHPDRLDDEISSTLDSERYVHQPPAEFFLERRIKKPIRKLAKTMGNWARLIGSDEISIRIKYSPDRLTNLDAHGND